MSTTTAATAAGNLVSDLGQFLTSFIPTVLVVFAGLVALGVAIHYVRKYIAGRRV